MPTLSERTQQLIDQYQPDRESLAHITGIVVLGAGIIFMAVYVFRQSYLPVTVFGLGWVLLFGLLNFAPIERALLGKNAFNLRHLLHIILYWSYSAGAVLAYGLMSGVEPAGKDSRLFYVFLMAFIAFVIATARSLLVLTVPRVYKHVSTDNPLWEQIMLAANEIIAVGLVSYVWSSVLVRVFQPSVFTTRLELTYSLGLGLATLIYYLATQMMWIQRWNDWLSRNDTWVRLTRLLSPFVLFVNSLVIYNRFTAQTDPRTAGLMDNADLDFAVLSLAPVVWLQVFTLMILVYSGRRGLRQRFLPDSLLKHLPDGIERLFRAISDMDFLLVIGVLTTFVPTYLLFFGADGGILGSARRIIEQRGSAFIETSEQALALLFILPYYTLAVLILILYALVISRPSISADERNEMMNRLPVGFMISMIIILYMFAVPFTQVFTEGRLPTLSRDLGRILALYILVPLLLLYIHFLPLVRFPFGRGQRLWRQAEAKNLEANLRDIDRRIRNLNQELVRMDNKWKLTAGNNDIDKLRNQLDTLHHYINLNSERDDLNMRRLQIVAARQNLAEISETPFSVTVARLPIRIISIGIPLLLLFQLYQWAVVSNGLRQVVNNPDITLIEFIQILLENIEF